MHHCPQTGESCITWGRFSGGSVREGGDRQVLPDWLSEFAVRWMPAEPGSRETHRVKTRQCTRSDRMGWLFFGGSPRGVKPGKSIRWGSLMPAEYLESFLPALGIVNVKD